MTPSMLPDEEVRLSKQPSARNPEGRRGWFVGVSAVPDAEPRHKKSKTRAEKKVPVTATALNPEYRELGDPGT